MRIETQFWRRHHCRIYITTDPGREKKIVDKAFALAMKHGPDLEYFEGCPASGPYLEASSDKLTQVSEWWWRMSSYLRKYKHLKYR